jgi:retron-type reverse transcriptase
MGLIDALRRLFGRRVERDTTLLQQRPPAKPGAQPKPAAPAAGAQPKSAAPAASKPAAPSPASLATPATPPPAPTRPAATPAPTAAPKPVPAPARPGVTPAPVAAPKPPAPQPTVASAAPAAAPLPTREKVVPSSLKAAPAPVEPTSEAVDLRPQPLKPGHQRLTLRDARLLPKGRTLRQKLGLRSKRPQHFTASEAARLFAPTLRTRDRNLRDLDTDPAQLARYGLPEWRDEADLAAALELDLKALRHLSTHSARERVLHYVTFAIPKRRGGERLIMAPKRRLKAVQRALNALLVSKLPVSSYAHGFRPKRSVRSNAQPHVGKRVVLRLDLREFFPSIHFGRVRGLLVSLGYGYPVATVLATLMTEAPRQPVRIGDQTFYPPVGSRACPQGAPTSPGLSNAVTMKLDHRLAGLARKRGFEYTRYADDLTFSGDDIAAAHALRLAAGRVIRDEGFEVNAEKTLVMRASGRQQVTGITVNRTLGLSRRERRTLRAALHREAQQRAAGNADASLLARLRGKLAYLFMLNPAQAARLGHRR